MHRWSSAQWDELQLVEELGEPGLGDAGVGQEDNAHQEARMPSQLLYPRYRPHARKTLGIERKLQGRTSESFLCLSRSFHYACSRLLGPVHLSADEIEDSSSFSSVQVRSLRRNFAPP